VHDDAVVHDNQIAPPRPVVFAFTRTSGFSVVDPEDGSGQQYILPDRPWAEIEFWLNGEQITQAEAEAILEVSRISVSELKWWPE
jgi:predicted XRE-type DNA-binding protein